MSDKLLLEFMDVEDFFGRPIYIDQYGKLWKDLNLGNGLPDLCSSDSFESEPGWPIEREFEIIGGYIVLEKENNNV